MKYPKIWVRKFHILLYKTDTRLFLSYCSSIVSLWLRSRPTRKNEFPMALGKIVSIFSRWAFSVLLIVNLKISLQRLKTGMWEMCTAVSGAAWNTVMDVWLYLKMEGTMPTHNSTFTATGEWWFARISTKFSPCFTIPTTCRKDPTIQRECFI